MKTGKHLFLLFLLPFLTTHASAQNKLLGGDISLLPSYEEAGAIYRDSAGVATEPLALFKQQGWNAMRVRLFCDPSAAPQGNKDEGVCQDLEYVKRLGRRIKEAGFKLMLDFHYSDTWADPGKQYVPRAWKDADADALADSVHAYTKRCLEELCGAGAKPDLIQVGNEISFGMLWPQGKTDPHSDAHWPAFTGMLRQGVKACREVCPEARLIIHTEQAGKWGNTKAFYDRLAAASLDYDIIGLSYYPMWHGSIATLSATLDSLATRYADKEIMIVEAAAYYSHENDRWAKSPDEFSEYYPISPAGQLEFTSKLIAELNTHPRVTGLFWWFPEENAHRNSLLPSWLNRGLFDNHTGKAMPSLYEMKRFGEMKLTTHAQQTEKLWLSGPDGDHAVAWDFRCSKGMKAGKWKKIAVPSCWELQGFGEYTYGRFYKKPGLRASDETGTYRHTFRVPQSWRGKKVELCFEGVFTDAEVSVNGRAAGSHQGGFTAFRLDVTELVAYGKKNTIEVNVAKESADKTVNDAERRADWWLFGGIYRPVYLRALPEVHIEDVAIDAQADGRLRLRLHAKGLADGYKLQASLPGHETKTLSLSPKEEQELLTAFSGVKPWDTEHPNLYPLTLRLLAPDGMVAHELTERIGFRTVEFRRREGFYLNGTKLLVKGVNRHCCYPETGRTTSRARDLADLRLIKAMNANAIRSHYAPDAALLSLCDSLGILYLEELAGWQRKYSTPTGTKMLTEMLAHDQNHPCIFAWSNGNEGGFNYDLDPLFGQLDLQRRHVVHAWSNFDGVDTHHYPAYQTGVARLHNGYDVFMPTEFLHAQYDKGGGASLSDYWAHWTASPLFAGGFIWAWADEGIVRTDRHGAIDTDGGNAPDGLVGPHREREGSYWTVRDVWSPVQIAPMTVRPGWNGQVRLSNGFLFSRLDEAATMDYQVLSLSESKGTIVLKGGALTLPSIAPDESGTARMDTTGLFLSADVLRLTARTPQGDTLNTWTFPMRYADEYFAAHHTAQPTEDKSTVDGTTLSAPNGIKATFDAATGLLTHLRNKDKEIALNGGPLPVGMKMELTGITRRTEGSDALLVMRYRGAVSSITWRMKADGLLGMEAVMLNRRDGGKFDGDFFDKEVRNLGFSFSYPEEGAQGMRWLGRGPYRVWRNRQRGTTLGIHQKPWNNTVTGQPDSLGRLVYPEFKGYHANLYWAELQSANNPVKFHSETDGLYLRLFTPEEPRVRNDGEPTMPSFPEGDLSFLLEIPSIRSYKPIEQLGPEAQPPHIRINKGDEGLRMKLWIDVRQ